MRRLVPLLAAVAFLACSGDIERPEPKGREVVVYTALDRQYSEPILDEFEKKTGIEVKAVYDTEAAKTVGLVNRIMAERSRPTCDVFWNNEVLRSVQIAREGLVEPYVSPSAADIPDAFKDAKGMWTGFAARARVLVIAKDLKGNPRPASLDDLVKAKSSPDAAPLAAIAKPLFGTTSTHAAVMWALGGREKTVAFWEAARANTALYPGNGPSCDAVVNKEALYGLTDTDDAQSVIADGAQVEIAYPTAGPEGEGFLLIPNSVVLINSAPNSAEGRELIDYLLSREVEAALAASRSAQIPVREGVKGPEKLPPPPLGKAIKVDWNKVADSLEASQKEMHRIFGQ